ncbi:MAG: hypothetical protein ACO24H_03420 [Polynucleobacter sp.]
MTNTNPSRKPAARKNGPVRIVKAAAQAAGQTAAVADAAAAEVAAATAAAADIGAGELSAEVLAELPESLRAAIEASRAQVAAASAAKRQRAKRVPFAMLTADQAAWIDRIGWSRPRAEVAKPVVQPRALRVNTGRGAGYLLACLASVEAGGAHMADLARLWFLVGPKGQQAPSLAQVLGFIARQTGRPVLRHGADISLG